MRAAWYEKQGAARDVLVVGEMPDPEPGPGEVRVKVAASGRKFGIVKATEGTGYTDSSFAANWAAMPKAGVIRGAYHFFHPNLDAVMQALALTDVVVGATVTALLLALVVQVHKRAGTLDPDALRATKE